MLQRFERSNELSCDNGISCLRWDTYILSNLDLFFEMTNNEYKTFLYLIQCEGSERPYNCDLSEENVDAVYLSWKEESENMIYYPNSTWTEGRNRLLEEARNLDKQYDFYIFMDDDLSFSKGGFREFEKLLIKYQPAIASPHLPGYNLNKEDLNLHVHTVFRFDAAMNAFHHSVVFDETVFPYVAKFDQHSWWYSQYVLIVVANVFYPSYILQFNTVEICNETHRQYPRDKLITDDQIKHGIEVDYFANVDTWIYQVLLASHPDVEATKRQYHFSNINLKPKPPRSSYNVTADTKSSYLR